jgi:NDP-sugar pyrophosphorylase family protein
MIKTFNFRGYKIPIDLMMFTGGLGTRISEESHPRPKPMIEIGGKPILWHIMKMYSQHGVNDFVICLGYEGYFIKEYFSNYFLHMFEEINQHLFCFIMRAKVNIAFMWCRSRVFW